MKKTFTTIASVLLISIICACNLQKAGTPVGTNTDSVATIVAMTLAAFTPPVQQTPVSSPTPGQPANNQAVTLSPTPTPTNTPTLTIGLTSTITVTIAASQTPIPKPGTIEGRISGYPYGSLPKLVIVAFGQEPPYYYSYLITSVGDTSYSMSNSYLIPGKFQVVAYDAANHTGGCPTFVTVISDQIVTCDITNWGGGYPAKPASVPNP